MSEEQKNSNPKDAQALVPLIELSNRLGFVYGSDDISMLFYTLIRRERPLNVLELGTGLGVTSFWMAQALKENGEGHVWTIDDGSHWQKASEVQQAAGYLTEVAPFSALKGEALDYPGFVRRATELLGLESQLTFFHESLDLTDDDQLASRRYPFLDQPIDYVFVDISRGPDEILDVFFLFLPHLAEAASIFIDSASTSLSGYLFLEKLVDQLNHSKVPRRFLMGKDPQRRRALMDLVALRKFTLLHLVERKARKQNSTAWIKIEPNDYVPHPMTLMKM